MEWDRCPDGFQLLCEVVSLITENNAERMTIVNLDETNRLEGENGRMYLQGVLGATKKVNALKNKVGFLYVILSGTNVRDLHNSCTVSSGSAPEEIALPLLEVHHVKEVLWDLQQRCSHL